MKNVLIIIVGPSGAGKSSFVERIIKEIPVLYDTVTCTTRAMRAGESEGNPYRFVSKEKFQEMIKNKIFIEYAEVHGNLYGTPSTEIEEPWKKNKAVIMDVDVQGAKTFKAKYPQAQTIFIMPPSIDALRQRVILRDGKGLKDLEVRMKTAEREIKEASSANYLLVNEDFEKAYTQFKKMIEEILKSR